VIVAFSEVLLILFAVVLRCLLDRQQEREDRGVGEGQIGTPRPTRRLYVIFASIDHVRSLESCIFPGEIRKNRHQKGKQGARVLRYDAIGNVIGV
jgi:hypothetical protein